LWCKSTYSEVFSAWVHVKAMRCFVESVLRYGLPVNFAASLLLPVKVYVLPFAPHDRQTTTRHERQLFNAALTSHHITHIS
jgi:hypothetical protein